MSRKIAILFAVLAVFSLANASSSTDDTTVTTTASFNSTYTAFINSTDTVFYNKIQASTTGFSSGTDNTTNYFFGLPDATGSGPYTFTVTRRKINSTTIAQVGSDETLTGVSCTSSSGYISDSGANGAYAFLCILQDSNSYNLLKLYMFTSSSTTATVKEVASPTATTTTIEPVSVVYDMGLQTWYALWVQQVGEATATYQLQAVNMTNSSNTILYAAGGVTVLTLPSGGVQNVHFGLNNVTNATTATFAYVETTGSNGKFLTITTSSGSAGSANSLTGVSTAATTSTAGQTITYSAVGLGYSYSTYFAAFQKQEINQASGVDGDGAPNGATTTTTTVFIYYNNSATSTENFTYSTTTYSQAAVQGLQYGSGYSIFQFLVPTAGGAVAAQYINYFGNGTVNGSSTATSIGTYGGTFDMWVDPNGALWVGSANSDADGNSGASTAITAGTVLNAGMGKLFGQVYLSGSVLSSVCSLVALLVASLLAF